MIVVLTPQRLCQKLWRASGNTTAMNSSTAAIVSSSDLSPGLRVDNWCCGACFVSTVFSTVCLADFGCGIDQ